MSVSVSVCVYIYIYIYAHFTPTAKAITNYLINLTLTILIDEMLVTAKRSFRFLREYICIYMRSIQYILLKSIDA